MTATARKRRVTFALPPDSEGNSQDTQDGSTYEESPVILKEPPSNNFKPKSILKKTKPVFQPITQPTFLPLSVINSVVNSLGGGGCFLSPESDSDINSFEEEFKERNKKTSLEKTTEINNSDKENQPHLNDITNPETNGIVEESDILNKPITVDKNSNYEEDRHIVNEDNTIEKTSIDIQIEDSVPPDSIIVNNSIKTSDNLQLEDSAHSPLINNSILLNETPQKDLEDIKNCKNLESITNTNSLNNTPIPKVLTTQNGVDPQKHLKRIKRDPQFTEEKAANLFSPILKRRNKQGVTENSSENSKLVYRPLRPLEQSNKPEESINDNPSPLKAVNSLVSSKLNLENSESSSKPVVRPTKVQNSSTNLSPPRTSSTSNSIPSNSTKKLLLEPLQRTLPFVSYSDNQRGDSSPTPPSPSQKLLRHSEKALLSFVPKRSIKMSKVVNPVSGNLNCAGEPDSITPAMRDDIKEKDLLIWIYNMIDEPARVDFEFFLKDGCILCKLMNKIKPGSIPEEEVTWEGSRSKQKNIKMFLDAAESYGVPKAKLFHMEDLLHLRHIPRVTRCVYALAKLAQDDPSIPNCPRLGDEPNFVTAVKKEYVPGHRDTKDVMNQLTATMQKKEEKKSGKHSLYK